MLSAPSGAGKTTVAKRLLRMDRRLARAVTCTTRPPRKGEKRGRDYSFLSPRRFEALRRKGAFLEWARVHGHRYGTPKEWAFRQTRRGKDVLLVIDVKGGRTVRRKVRDAILVFLMPPSMAVLKRRLSGRGSETPRGLKIRIRNARREMRAGTVYDHRVVNDRLSRTVREVLEIIRRERKRPDKHRQPLFTTTPIRHDLLAPGFAKATPRRAGQATKAPRKTVLFVI